MDVIIFFKAVSNLLFAAIVFLAIVITSAFSIVLYILKSLTLSQGNRKALIFRRR